MKAEQIFLQHWIKRQKRCETNCGRGIYQQLFLNGSKDFQALAARENVVVGVYNPVTPAGLFKLNYRMHDKYVIRG